jgi:3-oxoacyl-[acyl-carrier protein] reductase
MRLNLEDKVVLISGSSRGIGKSIAKSFLAEGAKVVVSGRKQEDINKFLEDNAAYKEKIMTFCGDLTQDIIIDQIVEKTLSKFGTIDCLIPNTGKGAVPFGCEVGSNEWEEAFEINMWASVKLTRKVFPVMKEKGGSIVFVTALAGLEAVDAPITYSTAKSALIAYAKNLSRELAKFNIRVNSVAPGNIIFPGGRWEEKLAENREKFMKYIDESVVMKRFGKPEEIADFVVFMSSDKASFLTGECICIDGGQRKGF